MADSSPSKREQRKRDREFRRNYAKSHQKQSGLPTSSVRRVLPPILFGLAIVIAAQHLIFHAANGRGQAALIEDIFFGYPMAMVIAVVGAFMLPARRTK
jgi:hypothetical protein